MKLIIYSSSIFLALVSSAENDKSKLEEWDAAADFEQSTTVNWYKLAIDPKPWFGKEIRLRGIVRYDIGYAQANPSCPILIFDTEESSRRSLPARSVLVVSENMEKACENETYPARAVLLMLQGKEIAISGTCKRGGMSPFSVCEIFGDVKIEILNSHERDNFPASLIK